MLYEDLDISTVVCLTCGAKVSVDKLAIVDVGETVAPDDVKAKGGFFQTIACPKCRKGVYFGFLIDLDDIEADEEIEEEPRPKPKKKVKKKKTKKAEGVTSDEPKKLQRTEDGTIIIDEDELPEEVIAMEQRAEAARRAAGVNKKKKKKKKKATDKPKPKPHTPNRARPNRAQCTTCGEIFETRDVSMGAFGSRCPKCMRQLKSRCG